MNQTTVRLNVADSVGILSLNQPESANALSALMMEEITKTLGDVQLRKDIRALIVTGSGKHFCAGADLNWMKSAATLNHSENLTDAGKLTKMFEALTNLRIPTLAVVRGAAYGGAVGLVACCDVVIASDRANFCLSEAKLGLAPAVIMPYLARRMLPGSLRRYALSAKVFSGQEAQHCGLVDVTATEDTLEKVIRDELNNLLACGPTAQMAIKALLDEVRSRAAVQGPYTSEIIAALRTGQEGQAGLSAFFDKKIAPWAQKLPENWSFQSVCQS